MSHVVVDASVFVDVRTEALPIDDVPALDVQRWLVPMHFDLEVINALRRLEFRQAIDRDGVDRAVNSLEDQILIRAQLDVLIPRIVDLRFKVTPYDAAYVALAEAADTSLVTRDARLARVAQGICPVELL